LAQKTRNTPLWCEVYFAILNLSGVNRECDRQMNRWRDGRTDILIAYDMLHYVARPKKLSHRRAVLARMTMSNV